MSRIVNAIKLPKFKPTTEWGRSIETQLIEFSQDVNIYTKRLIEFNVNTITADYTVDDQNLILADATSGVITVTFLPASMIKGVLYIVKKIDASGNAITLDGNGSETIDGASTASLASQYDVLRVVSDGSNLFTV